MSLFERLHAAYGISMLNYTEAKKQIPAKLTLE